MAAQKESESQFEQQFLFLFNALHKDTISLPSSSSIRYLLFCCRLLQPEEPFFAHKSCNKERSFKRQYLKIR